MARSRIMGAGALAGVFAELARGIERNVMPPAVHAGAEVVAARARALAPRLKIADPRRTAGDLANGIEVRPAERQRSGRYEAQVVVTGPAETYAAHEEFGTSKMAAQPFLRPAVLQQGDVALKAMKDRFAAGLADEVRRVRAKGTE